MLQSKGVFISSFVHVALGRSVVQITARVRELSEPVCLHRTSVFMNESVATLRRRTRNTPDPIWLRGNMYPPVSFFCAFLLDMADTDKVSVHHLLCFSNLALLLDFPGGFNLVPNCLSCGVRIHEVCAVLLL